jgi:hypothetical protein
LATDGGAAANLHFSAPSGKADTHIKNGEQVETQSPSNMMMSVNNGDELP